MPDGFDGVPASCQQHTAEHDAEVQFPSARHLSGLAFLHRRNRWRCNLQFRDAQPAAQSRSLVMASTQTQLDVARLATTPKVGIVFTVPPFPRVSEYDMRRAPAETVNAAMEVWRNELQSALQKTFDTIKASQ